MKIEVGNWIGEKQLDGSYLYKAKKSPSLLRPIKKKAQYKEQPQYPLIKEYEDVAKKRYKEDLRSIVVDIVKFINKI